MKRILSGVQPSGKLHLGNYFGAIQQHIALYKEPNTECFYFIADYHALTTLPDAESDPSKRAATMRAGVLDVAVSYLALGLDPEKVAFYRQSDIPEVAELAWILATVTGMGLLERAHSYKDKVAKGIAASVGLFTYPVLMAADILIVRSHVVPVGKDQVQHIEMTRDMAGYFNQNYQEVFPLPDFRLDKVPIVPGTDGQKMSKSYGNSIDIFAEGKALKKQVMGIVTDSTPLEAPKDPDKCTVFKLYTLFATDEEQAALAARYRAGGMGYGEAKQMLLAQIDAFFAPAREKRKERAAHPDKVEAILRKGAEKARVETRKTMELVRNAVGLRTVITMPSFDKRQCSLLLFVATSSEEKALRDAAISRGFAFERIDDETLGEYYWMGRIGNERVIAVRGKGMGPLGRGGSADLALRFRQATAASAIVQLGMAFGIAPPPKQAYRDVVVSSSLIPYDNRDVKPAGEGRYLVDYQRATRRQASPVLLPMFMRERGRAGQSFGVHIGALLSGAARIHTRIFRDELLAAVPGGEDPIVGGEMEAVGLLAADDEPVWCVVKGIVDFADEDRDGVYKQHRDAACRNAADFVLAALVNDARG